MAKKEEKNASPVLVQNRKAHYDYHILETYEAGLELVGTEVKALRERQGSIKEAYCKPVKGELMMIGSRINEYDKGNRFNHDPERNRKLLMHRNEIISLSQKIERKGLTLVMISGGEAGTETAALLAGE